MGSRVIGCGSYLPSNVLSNDDLAGLVDTSDEWIRSRTGITKRHIAADDEYTSHMAHDAAIAAIKDAGIDKSEIDLLIICTNTPDNTFPSVANKVQGALGLGKIPSFDLQAICSGFLYGLQVADLMLKSRKYKTILLVCADKMSSILDWADRSTCVLFGDGAGAIILRYDESNSGIIDSEIFSDGSFYDMLCTSGGVSSSRHSGTLQMKGAEVFKHAVNKMAESVKSILETNNIDIEDISYFIPHQANLRIINGVAAKFNLDPAKVVITIDKHANCSAASIPLALESLKASGKLKAGDIVVFSAFGAGATWGSAILKW